MLESKRLHAFDSLRGVMMLLGIIIHASLTFTVNCRVFHYPLSDVSRSVFYDCLIIIIHSFRMPVFFVMSGYFAMLLLRKKGLKQLILNRLKRIVLPLIIGWLTISAVIKALLMYTIDGVSVDSILHSFLFMKIYIGLPLFHLWFLYHLTIIYILFILLLLLPKAVKNSLAKATDAIISIGEKNLFLMIFLVSIPIFILVTLMRIGTIGTSIGFLPSPLIFITYFVYFIFGIMLFRNQDFILPVLMHRCWLLGGFAILLAIIHTYFIAQYFAHETPLLLLISARSNALLSWAMLFFLIGAFTRFLNTKHKVLDYLSRASYWLYLSHLPVMIFLSSIIIDMPYYHFLKFLFMIITTFASMLLVYHFLIRKTFIGALLNGRK
ncbi:MAG: acyltransferase family protein [Bacteroidetes bacterium]|nr:acyltransferase family protein [Bacteroidota bacterium]